MADPEKLDVEALLKKASSSSPQNSIYANMVRVHSGGSDVVIDLFLLSPNDDPSANETNAVHVQRIYLPVMVAKEMGSILGRVVDEWEKFFDVTLPTGTRSGNTE